MGLWGKSTSVESRPKFLKGDNAEGAGGRKEDAFATTRGWELKAGTAASGNGNECYGNSEQYGIKQSKCTNACIRSN